MTSEVTKFLIIQHDEHCVEHDISDIYSKLGLEPPKILVFNNIPACKLAYKLIIVHLNNNSKNLSDEHLIIPNRLYTLKDFKTLSDNSGHNTSYYLGIFNIINTIRRYYNYNNNQIQNLPEIKLQFFKDFKPNNINKDNWKYASEETKNKQKENVWNRIILSKSNIFEYNFDDRICFVPVNGILLGVFLKEYCILCKNPRQIIEDESDRLHCTEDYAIKINDKDGIHFVNGIQFPPILFSKIFINKNITGNEIINIENVEQRAIAIQYFGYDNLIKELGAKLIDTKDEFNLIDNMPISYELYEFDMKVGRFNILRKFRFVKVEDYSTHKKVTLGVPVMEQTNNVIGAIAWTFGMTAEEYKPQIQT